MCISNLLTDGTVIQYYISICVCSVTSVVFILCRVGQCSDKSLGLGLGLGLEKKSWLHHCYLVSGLLGTRIYM